MLLGLWAFLIPLIGPSVSFAYDTSSSWSFSARHWVYELLPAIAIFVGGLSLFVSRAGVGWLGALLAAVGGGWLAIAPAMHAVLGAGLLLPHFGGDAHRGLLIIAYFIGAGTLATYLAAYAHGLLSRRGVVRGSVRR
jgi:hypothetical protein